MPNSFSRSAFFSEPFRLMQQKFVSHLAQAAMYSIPPSLAYLVIAESLKFHAIQFYRHNSTVAINAQARGKVEQAYKNMGCENKEIYFCDVGFDFPHALTSVIDPKGVLFACGQPRTEEAYNELYAMAGHEALHTKENHAVKSEFAFFMLWEMMREMSFACLQMRTMTVFCGTFLCAAALSAQMNKALEYRADAVSAKKLHTEPELCRLFHRHPKDGGLGYPSFESREANLHRLDY